MSGVVETSLRMVRQPQAEEHPDGFSERIGNHGTLKRVVRNGKRWRGRAMALRWAVTGLMAAEKNFRRVRGYRATESPPPARGIWL